ncbi:uncharacterized protein LOC123560170 [Mercenaria mercenaria]|uniref:uncharacterized protein LOC123560170 n=1 Tax=Mercenaria mercenaria TaxID=6596 RepID=UPI00234F7290|nr:uncharacterized protein LOC123560170 [Mercenaria mercenaria]
MKLQNVADEDFRSAWFQKYEELDDNNNLQNSNQDHTWYRPRTLLLIELYKQNINRMNNPQVRKKTVWEQITAEINETCETKFQASQVEGRWKTILSSYRKCKDAKKESGAARKDYEFEEELDDILMDSHTTQPAFTFSSDSRCSSEETIVFDDFEEEWAPICEETCVDDFIPIH